MTFQSINPATGEPLSTYEEWSTEEAKNVVCKVHRSYLTWSRTGFDHRASLMRNTADILNKNSAEYARLMAEEMGKPLADGVAEAEKCAQACRYFANNAENFLARQPVSTAARRSFIAFNPIRIVLAVMPWNFPFWQAFRFAAPSLMAGNAALLKHASNVPGCALAIEKGSFSRSGLS
jgi:succinate-semialdehyde dehydrogenase/glutarate-semialdehyde dehydrogenase